MSKPILEYDQTVIDAVLENDRSVIDVLCGQNAGNHFHGMNDYLVRGICDDIGETRFDSSCIPSHDAFDIEFDTFENLGVKEKFQYLADQIEFVFKKEYEQCALFMHFGEKPPAPMEDVLRRTYGWFMVAQNRFVCHDSLYDDIFEHFRVQFMQWRSVVSDYYKETNHRCLLRFDLFRWAKDDYPIFFQPDRRDLFQYSENEDKDSSWMDRSDYNTVESLSLDRTSKKCAKVCVMTGRVWQRRLAYSVCEAVVDLNAKRECNFPIIVRDEMTNMMLDLCYKFKEQVLICEKVYSREVEVMRNRMMHDAIQHPSIAVFDETISLLESRFRCMDSRFFDHIVVHLYRWRYVVDEVYHATKFHVLLDINLFEKDKFGSAILSRPSRSLNGLVASVSKENSEICQKLQEYVTTCKRSLETDVEDVEQVLKRRKDVNGFKEANVVHGGVGVECFAVPLPDDVVRGDDVVINPITVLDAEVILQGNYFHWVGEDNDVPLGSQKVDVDGILGNYADVDEYSVMDVVQDAVSEVFGGLAMNIAHVRAV